jgi:hypothetical protein
MPRFHFDTFDGEEMSRDTDGLEFASLEDAKPEIMDTLTAIAHDKVRRRDVRECFIEVRDEAGKPVLRATLVIHVEDLRETPCEPSSLH